MKQISINKKELPVGLLIGIMILYSIMPLVGRFFSDLLTTYSYMVVLLVLTLFVMFEKGAKTLEYFVLLILPFMLWKVLEYIGAYGITFSPMNIVMWGYGILLDVLPFMAAVYIMRNHNGMIKPLAIVIAVAAVLTAVTSIVGYYIYPEAARFLATDFETTNELYQRLEWMNVGGYAVVYTLLLLYPLAIYAYKQKKIHLVTAVIIAVLLLVFILRSQYTIALLLFMVTSALFFTKKNLTAKRVWILLGAAAVLILVLWTFVSAGLELLAKNVESKAISERLFALSGGVDGLSHAEDKRWELYLRSLETIFKYPIIGGYWFESANTSAHSFILDMVAEWGILGVAAIFFLYRKVYNLFYKPYRFDEGFGYILWIFLQAIFLSTLNTGAWLAVIGCFVPILLCYIDNKREIKSVRLKREFAEAAESTADEDAAPEETK